MSILIKGMEMPKSCFDCPFVDFEYGDCLVDENGHGDPNEPENCPLIPVPNHGRLIDADALENRVVPASRFFDIPNANVVVLGVIKAAPTIIQADPSKEET